MKNRKGWGKQVEPLPICTPQLVVRWLDQPLPRQSRSAQATKATKASRLAKPFLRSTRSRENGAKQADAILLSVIGGHIQSRFTCDNSNVNITPHEGMRIESLPAAFLSDASAPLANNISSIFARPPMAAHIRPVWPAGFVALIWAPFESRSSATSTCPRSHASWSAGAPSWSTQT
jgi:hypothetical protein